MLHLRPALEFALAGDGRDGADGDVAVGRVLNPDNALVAGDGVVVDRTRRGRTGEVGQPGTG